MKIRITRSIRSIFIALSILLMVSTHIVLAEIQSPPIVDDDPLFWLDITSTSPSNSISQQQGTINTYNVTLNQQALSKWFLDGIVQPQTSLRYAKKWYARDVGLHNITYVGSVSGDYISNTWIVTVLDFADNAPVTSLVFPESPYVTNSISAAFTCYATDDIGLVNMTLFGSWSGWGAKKTNALTGVGSSTEFTENISEGEYVWNCMARDSIGNEGFASSNNTLIISMTANTTVSLPSEIPLNAAYARIIQWPNAINISPGSSLDFQLTVNNTGRASVDGLFLESLSSWIKVDGNKFVLAPAEIKTLPASLSVPSFVTPGPRRLSILLKTSNKTFDKIFIPVIVLDKSGSANISTTGIEDIRQELERVKNSTSMLSGQGYDTSVAKGYANTAEGLLNKTEYYNASDYIALADKELEKSINSKNAIQTTPKSYVPFGILIFLFVLLYFIFKKHLVNKKNSALNAEEDYMVKRLREIKKHVGK